MILKKNTKVTGHIVCFHHLRKICSSHDSFVLTWKWTYRPHVYKQLFFDTGTKATEWKKGWTYKKWSWVAIEKQIKGQPLLHTIFKI